MTEDEHDRRITAAQEAERPASRGRRLARHPTDPYLPEVRSGRGGYVWRVLSAAGDAVAEGVAPCRGEADYAADEVVAALTIEALRAQLRAMHRRAQGAESEAAKQERRAEREKARADWWRDAYRGIESRKVTRLVSVDLVAERDAALARVRELGTELSKAREGLAFARNDVLRELAEWYAEASPAPSWRNLWGLL